MTDAEAWAVRRARDLEWANALWPEGERGAWILPEVGGAWHAKQVQELRQQVERLRSRLAKRRKAEKC